MGDDHSSGWVTPSRRRLLAGLGAAGVTGFAGCAGGDGGGDGRSAGSSGGVGTGTGSGEAGDADGSTDPGSAAETVVRIGIANGGWDLVPARDTDFDSNKVYTLVYDNVVDLNPATEVVPDLAESWSRESDTQYVFELEEGVTFHNGEPFTAADVEYTYEWIRDTENPRKNYVSAVENVVVENDHRVRFDLSEPYAPFLYKLHAVMWPLSRTAIEEHGDEYNQHPVGTGPFRLTEWDSGNRAVLEAYDDYWRDDQPKIDRIEFRILPEDSSKVAQLETGSIDLVDRLPPQFTGRVESSGTARVITTTGVSSGRVDFNTDVEPLGDRRVRRALAWAIDKERIVETVLQGFGVAGKAILPDSYPQYNDAISEFNHPTGDPDRARELLGEAGYGDGLSLGIKTSTQSRHRRAATLIQSMWGEVGVDVSIQSLEGNAFWSQETSGDFEVAVSNFTWFGDPDTLLYLYHSEGLNVWNLSNAELDGLLEDQRRAVDPETRAELMNEIQRLTYEEAYSIYTYYPQRIQGISNRIDGFEQYPNGSFRSLDGATVE
jgi:peptide/nickel transport system substrate-binding protein